jgi:hypothetical protein
VTETANGVDIHGCLRVYRNKGVEQLFNFHGLTLVSLTDQSHFPKLLHAGDTHQASPSIESSAERKILRYKVLSSASAAQGRVITSAARVGEVVVFAWKS